jgi:hypothetical protein
MFALFCLLTITKEQVESLGDEELASVANRFMWFHNNRQNQRLGGSKDGCFNYDDPDHFVTNCHKNGKSEANPHDHHFDQCKGKWEYTSSKYMSKGEFD